MKESCGKTENYAIDKVFEVRESFPEPVLLQLCLEADWGLNKQKT